jgi:hypothetical protein
MNCKREWTIGILLNKLLFHGPNYSYPNTRLNGTSRIRKENPRMKKIRVIQNKISTPFEIAGLR